MSGSIATESGVLPVNGRRLEFERHRPAGSRGPTLVLLHEGLGSVAMWGDFPRALSRATGCPVLAYSRKGHGRSDPEDAPRGPDFMHREAWDDLPAVLAAAELERFYLVGHSDGGSIALLYAGRPEVRDPALAGLVLLAAHAFNEPACVAGIERASDAFARGGLRSALARYHGTRVDEVFARWRDIWLDPAFEAWNIEDVLSAVDRPVLVMQGADDAYGSADQVRRIAAGVSGPAEAVLLEGCGHVLHREPAAGCEARIARFVERCEAAAPGSAPA